MGNGNVTALGIHSDARANIFKESNMHTNESFLTKLNAEQINELRALALTLDSNVTGSASGAYTRALHEQLNRLGV